MRCQLCDNGHATVKIAHTINEQIIEIKLCKKCAQQQGIDDSATPSAQIFDDYAEGFDNVVRALEEPSDKEVSCRNCGLTWETFQDTGLFGCDICYLTFTNELNVVLRRIHGSHQHIGSRPKSQRIIIADDELARVKLELQQAILNENFELAAELRDLIRDARGEDQQSESDGILR